MAKPYRIAKDNITICFAAFLILLYFTRLTADSISGIFGIIWSDEGIYLLSAKNQALFGQAHFFLKDLWRPELIAPYLHHLALLTITQAEPLLWVHTAVALHVLCGMALIGWLAAKYYGNRNHGITCFVWLALNPILFFYARAGLSEGLQFFIMTLILAVLFYLHDATEFRRALILCMLGGALVAVFVLAKISAAPAGCVLCIGMAATLRLHASLPRKKLLFLAFALTGIAVTAAYFGLVIGDQFPEWWRANVEMEVATHAPGSPFMMLMMFILNNTDTAFFFCFMPVFTLYFTSLFFAADRKKGLLFLLWIITVCMLLAESFLGGEIRRVFFSVSMLSLLFGFSAPEFFAHGIECNLKALPLMLIGACIVLIHTGGLLLLIIRAALHADYMLALFCLIFLVLLVLVFQTAKPWFAGSRQRAVIAAIALCSLFPMCFQAFLAPRTADSIAVSIADRVPENATIVGQLAPWFMERLERRIIFTNCTTSLFSYVTGNDMDTVTGFADFFIGDQSSTGCMPPGYSDDNIIGVYSIFNPMNQRKLWEFYHHIGYNGFVVLYEK